MKNNDHSAMALPVCIGLGVALGAALGNISMGIAFGALAGGLFSIIGKKNNKDDNDPA